MSVQWLDFLLGQTCDEISFRNVGYSIGLIIQLKICFSHLNTNANNEKEMEQFLLSKKKPQEVFNWLYNSIT